MMQIRLAEIFDVPELNKLNILFNGEGCSSIKIIEESLKNNAREIVVVADEEDRLVGFCCGQIFKSVCYSYNYSEITELYIMKEYRRKGIGKQLIDFMETEFIKRGVKHIHILTGKDNKIAQSLYHLCGYIETSEILLDKDL